jgi:hypothetical protein
MQSTGRRRFAGHILSCSAAIGVVVWQWRARAGHGPIEHTILIQNLSQQSVWLPLQPGFRCCWTLSSELIFLEEVR